MLPTALRLPLSAFCFLLSAFCLLPVTAWPQQRTPYATIDRNAVTYSGPGRDNGHDLKNGDVRIGLLIPLTGPRWAEGDALRQGAEMAVDEANASAPATGSRLRLAIRDESGPWGQASTQIVKLVFEDGAIAVMTSSEGGAAHLAEQVANKAGVPVMTLSTDNTTTEINLPWIFRLGPSDRDQAQLFAREIYAKRGVGRVLLFTQSDHDGRVGADEFTKAARATNAAPPRQIVIPPGAAPETVDWKQLSATEAVVIWADSSTAHRWAVHAHGALPRAPVYLCRRAVEDYSLAEIRQDCATCSNPDSRECIAAAPDTEKAWMKFCQSYRQKYGARPAVGAAEAYDAVRILASTLRTSGPNRARLRVALAEVSKFAGASGTISFDHAGNNTSPLTLLKIEE